MEKIECEKLISKLDEMIADEEHADEEYTELSKLIRMSKPSGAMKIMRDIDDITFDEFKHKLKLIEIREQIKNQCALL